MNIDKNKKKSFPLTQNVFAFKLRIGKSCNFFLTKFVCHKLQILVIKNH